MRMRLNFYIYSFLSSKVVFGEFPMQMCLVHHKTFMFQPMNQTHFGIYELELHQFEHHQIIDAADIKVCLFIY